MATSNDIPISSNFSSERIDFLRKREAALKTAIAAELHRQQKRDDRNKAKLVSIVGAALLDHAKRSQDVELMVRTVLKTVTETRSRQFLKDMGW